MPTTPTTRPWRVRSHDDSTLYCPLSNHRHGSVTDMATRVTVRIQCPNTRSGKPRYRYDRSTLKECYRKYARCGISARKVFLPVTHHDPLNLTSSNQRFHIIHPSSQGAWHLSPAGPPTSPRNPDRWDKIAITMNICHTAWPPPPI